MKEASKIKERWRREGLWDRYIKSTLLDVGCGDDKIVEWADGYDIEQGDAQLLVDIPNQSYNTLFSSHCIEHMRNPAVALVNWWRVLKPEGHMIIVGPEEDLYEQGVWPSLANGDHKRTFALSKAHSWSPDTVNILELIAKLPDHKLISARIVDDGYDYARQAKPKEGQITFIDQTQEGAEANIEVIVKKLGWQPEWFPMYKGMISCSECGWNRVMIEGFSDKNEIIIRCDKCGNRGLYIP